MNKLKIKQREKDLFAQQGLKGFTKCKYKLKQQLSHLGSARKTKTTINQNLHKYPLIFVKQEVATRQTQN